MLRRLRSRFLPLAFVLGLLLFAGCSHNARTRDMMTAWNAGDLPRASEEVTQAAEKHDGGRDGLIFQLEKGAVLRAAGRFEESNKAFDNAEARVNTFEAKAKVLVGSESLAIFTNQASLPYRGRAYDKVMMNTYKALNYLKLGQLEPARVELNRALQRQRDAVEANAKRIEASQEARKKARQGKLDDGKGGKAPAYDTSRTEKDPKFAAASGQILAQADALQPYADYVNPFTTFLDGLYHLATAHDASEVERALKSFERAAAMAPSSEIQADYALAQEVANGGRVPPMTYVIFETGRAPIRQENRIDIPLFIFTDNLSYLGTNFPSLAVVGGYHPDLTVEAGGQSRNTALLCSMDSVVSHDFKNEWPEILTRTILTMAPGRSRITPPTRRWRIRTGPCA